MINKKKVEENPETFRIAKPEVKKKSTPLFIKLIVALVIILLCILIYWEKYQIYNYIPEEEIKTYDGVSTISGTNIPAGNTLTQTFNIDDSFNLSVLNQETLDGIKYKVYKDREEYLNFYSKYKVGRDFSEQDFENFYLIVLYKDGTELKFVDRFCNMSYDNILLKSEETTAKYVTFLVLPRVKVSDLNITLKIGNSIILENEESVLDKMINNLTMFSNYFSNKYFENKPMKDSKYYIEEIKLINDKANNNLKDSTKELIDEAKEEPKTYWQAEVTLEQNTNYTLKVLVDPESGNIVGVYDLSKDDRNK